MGMCKKCQSMFNPLKMEGEYCFACYAKFTEDEKNEIKKQEEERKKQEEERKKQEEERKKQEQEEKEKYQQKLANILILSGTINKEHTLHGMITVVAEGFEFEYGLHKSTVEIAEILMRKELVNLGFDGILNTKIDSTVTLGKRKNNDKHPYYTVVFYGDAFTFD